jgi:hypothetical protein
MLPRRMRPFWMGLFLAASSALCACAARYTAPALPAQQLARVTLDERATVLSVAGLEPPQKDGSDVTEFRIETGCLELVVEYQQTESTLNLERSTLIGAPEEIANSEHHHYRTFQPIRFFVPARAGHTYWVTATFTGDQFLPRVVELDASGSTLQRFEPDVNCGKNSAGWTASSASCSTTEDGERCGATHGFAPTPAK